MFTNRTRNRNQLTQIGILSALLFLAALCLVVFHTNSTSSLVSRTIALTAFLFLGIFGWLQAVKNMNGLREDSLDSANSIEAIVAGCAEANAVKPEETIGCWNKILDDLDDEIYFFDSKTLRVIWANKKANRCLGHLPEDTACFTLFDLGYDFLKEDFESQVKPLRNGAQELLKFEDIQMQSDGTMYPAEIQLRLYQNADSPFFVLIVHDITDRKTAEWLLLESEERYSCLLSLSSDAIVIYDEEKLMYVNEAGVRLIGAENIKSIIGKSMLDFIHPDYHENARERTRLLLQGKTVGWVEEKLVRLDGKTVDVELLATLIVYQGKSVIQTIIRDITERKRAEDMLNYMAYYDFLTELPNRALFNDRLNLALAHAHRNREGLAMLYLDLDNFKTINDTLGHDLGDQLLQNVTRRLICCVREGDTVSRFGGDEFVILLPEVNNAEGAIKVAKKVIDALKPPFNLNGQEVHITTSIGVSLHPHDGDDAQTLLKNAEIALYRAKDQGRDNYQLYTSEMNTHVLMRLALENSLRGALEREEFRLYYQPQVDIGSGKIMGLEALIRWQHPDLGTVPPIDFIPLAEETGLIIPIGEWVLRTACKQNKQWQDQGYMPVRVAINLSARQFQQPNLVEMIDSVLEETGLDPQYLELEITESIVMQDIDRTIKILQKLRERGLHISIDDFGTGYSSLSYLKRFPISRLKIDRVFIRTLHSDLSDAAITKAIIAMAHSLSLKTVAEGVEKVEQLEFLRELECDEVQGYLFSEPLPANEITHLLAEENRLCA